MIKSSVPDWLLQKEKSLVTNGLLDLTGEAISDLSIIKTKTSLKILNLSFTTITSFEGLGVQPNIEHVILSSSSIQTLKNINSVKKMTKINIENTPLSRNPHCKLSLLIVCGNNLRVINGKLISATLRKKAEAYPPVAAQLINAGWMAVYPCPSAEEISKLCAEYSIFENEEEKHLTKTNKQTERDIDAIINAYTSVHQEMMQEAEFRLNEEVASGDDVNFEDPLSQLTARFPTEKVGTLDENGSIVSDLSSFSDMSSFDQKSSIHISETGEETQVTPIDDDGKGRLADRIIEVFKKYIDQYDAPERNPNESVLNTIDQLLVATEDDFNNDYSSEGLSDNLSAEEEEEKKEENIVETKNIDNNDIEPTERRRTPNIPPIPRPPS